MTRQRFPNTQSRPTAPLARRYVTAVLAREALRDVAAVLSARGIPVMPLKGVLFQLVLYADPSVRALTDIDVLVPEQEFAAAIEALLQAGFTPRSAGRSLIECSLRAPCGMTVDLHQQLFSRGRYKLSTEAVFRRATRDDALLGVPLYIAHPHDTAAHLIGKFVSDHEANDPQLRLAELSQWIRHCSIQSRRLVRHLRACGMTRAARYVVRRGIELSEDPFFRTALFDLPRDILGAAYVEIAHATIPRLKSNPWASVPAHLLNESIVRGGASLALAAVDRMHHAWLVRQRGSRGGYFSPFFAAKARRLGGRARLRSAGALS